MNITCKAVLEQVVDTAVVILATWIDPYDQELENSSRITVLPTMSVEEHEYISVLIFYPVDNSDAGHYQCNVWTESHSAYEFEPLLLPTESAAAINIITESKHCSWWLGTS